MTSIKLPSFYLTVNIDWCSQHGVCYRNSKVKDDVLCCCETGEYLLCLFSKILYLLFI